MSLTRKRHGREQRHHRRLFNYLVRTRYEPGRNFVTDRFGRLEIDDQLKPCRLTSIRAEAMTVLLKLAI
ncbi:hypothetical protein [Bradyrhizobium erythrophlei]|jgi:hypothetical protein|uniref:hypothetical protein n=1 Tax=Bradyrhizobium erythrophlei TaxID=1437360 RepID=UPI00093411BD|nr:hypothetical protein [Bradyrhizobium erythrophlei]